jgi:hypothetical protein
VVNGGGIWSLVNWLVLLLIFPVTILLIPSQRRFVLIGAGTILLILSIAASAALFHKGHYFFDPTGQIYAWFFMLLWLALQKAVPALGSALQIILTPQDSVDETILPPPGRSELDAALPKTDTSAFVIKSMALKSDRPLSSGTIVERKVEDLQGKNVSEAKDSSAEKPDPLLKSREIAGGTILRCLGSGGFADVYLTWNPRLEVYRAVKVIKPGQPPNVLQRFETEIRIFSKLDHPNIVHSYSVGDWYTLPYVEMEFINWAPLDEILDKCKFLSTEQSLSVAILVCRALQYAHNQTITIYGTNYKGIVHRDLKPANIMMSRTGRIKLTDFGIARPGSVSLHTVDAGAIVGTLPYLAPEQVEGGELTVRADIYALGVTLYEFLTGEKAFPQTEVAQMLNAKLQGTYKPIAPSGRISKDIISVVDKAMATKTIDRYATAQAFKDDLERAFIAHYSQDGFSHIVQLVKRVWQ